ncbi:hypothetical protein K440DRAFT_623831 [Wilcoxina mikolae CBS 423.85]|nr:hypothetical protein K440DRAFT_623831 [Wilcoxina mikolae CBS 423.85]
MFYYTIRALKSFGITPNKKIPLSSDNPPHFRRRPLSLINKTHLPISPFPHSHPNLHRHVAF